jgi:hypothetical protein
MRNEREIHQRLQSTNDAFVIEVLRWVLDGDCPMCNHKDRRNHEVAVNSGDVDYPYLEVKYNWPSGTVSTHMNNHVDYNISEANHIESARKQSIDTLDTAEDIIRRIQGYLDELEEQKDAVGITSEFVADAAKLIGQANSSLKLIGQLKMEIGVDSQLLLASAQMGHMSNLLVEVLGDHPKLLDQIEIKMATLKDPTVIDVDFEVKEL